MAFHTVREITQGSRLRSALPWATGLILLSIHGQPGAGGGTPGERPPAPEAQEPRHVAFTGVHLLPMDREGSLRDQVLVVQGEEILRFGPAGETEIPPGARRIDGAGGYLLPGLVDAHAHAGREALPLYLASGVTTVRLMHGFPERLERRRRAELEAVPWPNLLTAGPLIAGEEVPWDHVLVESPEEARAVVEAQARAGYDFLKVYDGLSLASYDALVARARALGIPFVGHIPVDVGVERALEAGQRTVEHAEQLLYATFGRAGIMQIPAARTDTIVHLFERSLDEPADAGTCVTPTLRGMTLVMRRGTPFTDSLFARLEWDLVDPDLRDWWRSYQPPAPAEARPRREHFLEIQRVLTRKLHEAGVPILAGTDAPYPLLLPGSSLIEEVKTLADAGLGRFEALAAATRNAGRCLGAEGATLGVLRPGSRADLLLLASDPSADLGALERPLGAMVRGRWYDREALAGLREDVRRAYAP